MWYWRSTSKAVEGCWGPRKPLLHGRGAADTAARRQWSKMGLAHVPGVPASMHWMSLDEAELLCAGKAVGV